MVSSAQPSESLHLAATVSDKADQRPGQHFCGTESTVLTSVLTRRAVLKVGISLHLRGQGADGPQGLHALC